MFHLISNEFETIICFQLEFIIVINLLSSFVLNLEQHKLESDELNQIINGLRKY